MSSAPKKRRSRSRPFPILREPSPSVFPSKGEVLRLLAVVAIAAAVVYACNRVALFLNRQPKPFCDSGDFSQYPVHDICEPCPENAECSSGWFVCLHGYKSLGRKCVEDGEINQTAKKLSDYVEDHVCKAYAQALCDEDGKIWFAEEDILKFLDEQESYSFKEAISTFVKQKVLETLQSSLETTENVVKEYRCPYMQAYQHRPLDCRIHQWIFGHALLVATTLIVLLIVTMLIWSWQKRRKLLARAEELYEQVCDILEDNATIANKNNKGDPWVVASWLRDDLLLPRERKDTRLWNKVEELLQEDSRIDRYSKKVKGEPKIVLEWQVEGSLSSKTKGKRAMSKAKPTRQIETTYQQKEAAASEFLNS